MELTALQELRATNAGTLHTGGMGSTRMGCTAARSPAGVEAPRAGGPLAARVAVVPVSRGTGLVEANASKEPWCSRALGRLLPSSDKS